MALRERAILSHLALASLVCSYACSPQPQTHPLQTAPIPSNVRFLEQCSTLGTLMCQAVSAVSGDKAVERGPACIAYIETSGRKVEQCGSLPASHTANIPPSVTAPPVVTPPAGVTPTGKTTRLSWKDNSADESGFRVYRITGNQKIKLAEVGPNTTTYVDNNAPPKACYVVVAYNAAGESAPTSEICRPD